MSRVKFNARVEYEYLENFKVLQQCFKRNGIDKVSYIRIRFVWFDETDRCSPYQSRSLSSEWRHTLHLSRSSHELTRKMQDAGQPRIPTMAQKVLGRQSFWANV